MESQRNGVEKQGEAKTGFEQRRHGGASRRIDGRCNGEAKQQNEWQRKGVDKKYAEPRGMGKEPTRGAEICYVKEWLRDESLGVESNGMAPG